MPRRGSSWTWVTTTLTWTDSCAGSDDGTQRAPTKVSGDVDRCGNTGAGKIPLPVYNFQRVYTIHPKCHPIRCVISQMNYLYLKPPFHISNSTFISQAVISQNQYLRYAYISTRCFLAKFHISTPYLRYAHILKPQYFISQVHISDTSSYLNTFSRQEAHEYSQWAAISILELPFLTICKPRSKLHFGEIREDRKNCESPHRE